MAPKLNGGMAIVCSGRLSFYGFFKSYSIYYLEIENKIVFQFLSGSRFPIFSLGLKDCGVALAFAVLKSSLDSLRVGSWKKVFVKASY